MKCLVFLLCIELSLDIIVLSGILILTFQIVWRDYKNKEER